MAELADAIGSNPIIRMDGESSSLSRSTSHLLFNVGSVKNSEMFIVIAAVEWRPSLTNIAFWLVF